MPECWTLYVTQCFIVLQSAGRYMLHSVSLCYRVLDVICYTVLHCIIECWVLYVTQCFIVLQSAGCTPSYQVPRYHMLHCIALCSYRKKREEKPPARERVSEPPHPRMPKMGTFGSQVCVCVCVCVCVQCVCSPSLVPRLFLVEERAWQH